MIRLQSVDEQPFSADTFPLFATGYITMCVILVLVLPILANPTTSPPAGRLAGNPSISSLKSWVRATGKPSLIRGIVAEQLGLPAADLAVIERGFRKEGEQFTHVCSIGAAPLPELLFLASVDETSGDAKIWRVNTKGDVVATVLFSNQSARQIQNSSIDTEFRSEMAYFLAKAPASAALIPEKPLSDKGKSAPADFKTTALLVNSGAKAPPAFIPRRPPSSRSAELIALFATPFVLPIVVLILVIGAVPVSKRRD